MPLQRCLEFDPYLFWKLQPNLENVRIPVRRHEYRFAFRVCTNGHSLRGGPLGEKGEAPRIPMIGDSRTFGLGVNGDETWPAQIEHILNEKEALRRVEVVNAGVIGYSSFQGLRYLKSEGLALEPDLVIASFWVNDATPVASLPDRKRAQQLALVDWETPLRRSRLYHALQWLVQKRGTLELRENATMLRLRPKYFEETLRAIHALCDSRGIPVVFVIWPAREQVEQKRGLESYQPLVLGVAEELGAPLVNLLPCFASADGNLFVDGQHGNARGCQIAAEETADVLRRVLKRLPSMPPGGPA